MTDLQDLRKHYDSFVSECCTNKVNYERKGILNIEGFYWWSLVGHFRPDVILESGVAYGRSTDILARAQKYFKIPHHYAFDIEDKHFDHVKSKLKPFKTIYQTMDSVGGFQTVLDAYPKAKVVSIIDGPKSGKPFKQLIELLSKFPNFCALGCHDCIPEGRIPPNLKEQCTRFFPDRTFMITNPEMNKDLMSLNDVIAPDITRKFGEQKCKELLVRSNYVGLCF